jgi:hypothetical protein
MLGRCLLREGILLAAAPDLDSPHPPDWGAPYFDTFRVLFMGGRLT